MGGRDQLVKDFVFAINPQDLMTVLLTDLGFETLPSCHLPNSLARYFFGWIDSRKDALFWEPNLINCWFEYLSFTDKLLRKEGLT